MPAALVTSKQLVLYAEGSRYLNQPVLTPKLSYFDQPVLTPKLLATSINLSLRRSFWLLRSTCPYAEGVR
jgi:hypothetical protein